MKKQFAFLLLLISSTTVLGDEPTVESQIYETAGTQAEIAKRGESCIAQLVRNDPFNERDTAGPVIVSMQPDRIVANNRILIPARGFLTIDELVQSTLTLMSRDGKFRIRHDNIRFAFPKHGGFENLPAKSPARKTYIEALENLNQKIATCMMTSDW